MSAPDSGRGVLPASADRLPAQTFNQQPDAELKGLTKLGVVVEDLSPQAAACGLSQGTLETAVSKRLSDAGFRVLRNSDEDTYVYVNVITTSLSTGLCVSRYDAFLYTHTTARLSYQETPVLVQVSLLHKGGIAGGASAAHAEGFFGVCRSTSISFRPGSATRTSSHNDRIESPGPKFQTIPPPGNGGNGGPTVIASGPPPFSKLGKKNTERMNIQGKGPKRVRQRGGRRGGFASFPSERRKFRDKGAF